jgi:mitotic-spindle organizing protein 1
MNISSAEDVLETRQDEVEALFGLSSILQCGLDKRTLAVLLQLVEAGVHPEALADLVLEYRSKAENAEIKR